jgi:hypothetical protein
MREAFRVEMRDAGWLHAAKPVAAAAPAPLTAERLGRVAGPEPELEQEQESSVRLVTSAQSSASAAKCASPAASHVVPGAAAALHTNVGMEPTLVPEPPPPPLLSPPPPPPRQQQQQMGL